LTGEASACHFYKAKRVFKGDSLALPGTPKNGGILKVSHRNSFLVLNVLRISGPDEHPAQDVIRPGRDRRMAPPPEHKPIAGWRLAAMGSQLTCDFAFSNKVRIGKPVAIEELH
jgi:hypothetical protein